MKHIDLFSGIGGFALAARWMGWETTQFVELDPWAQRVLAKNFPGVPIHDDVTTYRGKPGTANIITGGFPCQDISYAGKGAGIEGERSGLWSEIARLIGNIRPEYAVMENVTGLLNRGLDRVLGDLASIGYDAEWHCIPATAIGAPHQRDRVWIIAYPMRVGRINGPGCIDRQTEINEKRRKELGRGSFAPGMVGDLQRKCDQWATEPSVGRVANGVPRRVDRLRGLGNAIVPQVAHMIFKAISV